MIGTNNRHEPQQTAGGIKAVLDYLKEKKPKMKILLLAIFPRGADENDPHRIRNEEINKILPSFADGKQVVFLDINDRFVDKDGKLLKSLMPDLLHPNPKGYEVWAKAMAEPLKKIMGER